LQGRLTTLELFKNEDRPRLQIRANFLISFDFPLIMISPASFLPRRFWLSLFSSLLLFAGIENASAVLANVWHIPNNTADLSGTNMRSPWIEISNNPAQPTTITVFNGLQRTGNGFGTANQYTGTLFYKGQDDVTWLTTPISYVRDVAPNNQFWKAEFSTSAFAANEVIQYYFEINFNTDNGGNGTVETSYLYAPTGTGDNGGATTANQGTAAASPYTVRNRPGWVFHADNRVVSGTNVQVWAKVGYIGDVNNQATRWADNGAVYYTTDGSDPVAGATPGTSGNGSTQVVSLGYSHPESTGGGQGGNNSVAGTPMWWVGQLTNLPAATLIKYKVGLWHSANNEQKFGEYNAGDGGNQSGRIFSFSLGSVGDPVLTVNGLNANYTTSKLFVDETASQSQSLSIVFEPAKPNITAVEVFSNLNRRDRAQLDADNDGVEDGIKPPSGDLIVAGSNNHYFAAYTMNSGTVAGQYVLTLSGSKTGSYRLTGRFKVSNAIPENGNNADNWIYYTNGPGNRRDHAITVSPVDARNIRLYEMNVLTIESTASNFVSRSTFEDLHNAPGAPHNGNNRWDLTYLQNLGCNWLWFQPIHPVGIEGRENDPLTGVGYDPGSPYAVKNFFEVNELMTVNYSGTANLTQNRQASMTAFQNFVAAADAAQVGVMLDAPFNHTGFDCELSGTGVAIWGGNGNPGNWQATDKIKDREARFYSRTNNYAMRATSAAAVATAPDRNDFGKWNDVKDVFFGRYAALVDVAPGGNGNYNNEGDWFDYSVGSEESSGNGNGHFDSVTQGVWKYFAAYTLHWLDKTGVPVGANLATQTNYGVDGLRADFGQGLPPQVWEYIVNKTRTRKWNFVFMAESLDGGAVTYRSNRHFDVLNENIVFPLKDASNVTAYRNIFEGRRNAYGQGLVLLNNTSHDEENYVDPWKALVRYAVVSAMDGAPLIFPGQELGISRTTGYQQYETNFGKQIAHFKRWNSLKPAWDDNNYGNNQLEYVYQGIGQARGFSRALRGSSRYFLDQTGGGGTHQEIYAVAKYETANGSPASNDVVFAFANINRDAGPTGNFNVNITSGTSNLFGIKAGRNYNTKNIAAYTAINGNRRNIWQWRTNQADESSGPAPRSGSDVINNGIFVGMNRVPLADGTWATAPYEAQYLKLYDVTAPTVTPSQPAGPNVFAYEIGSNVQFAWNAVAADSEGVTPTYRVNISINGGAPTVIYTSGTHYTVNAAEGQNVAVTVQAVNPSDNTQVGSASTSSGAINLLSSAADQDGDGMANGSEKTAGTNPLDRASIFRCTDASSSAAGQFTVTWSSVPGKSYQVETLGELTNTWGDIGPVHVAGGGEFTKSYTDTNASGTKKFYRVKVL